MLEAREDDHAQLFALAPRQDVHPWLVTGRRCERRQLGAEGMESRDDRGGVGGLKRDEWPKRRTCVEAQACRRRDKFPFEAVILALDGHKATVAGLEVQVIGRGCAALRAVVEDR